MYGDWPHPTYGKHPLMTQPDPVVPDPVVPDPVVPDPVREQIEAIKAWRKMPRAARRSTWARVNATRPDAPKEATGGRRTLRAPWTALPSPTPLQMHILSGRALPGSRKTLAVALGFNRAQRRAMVAKKGPATMVKYGRSTSRWAGVWNKFSIRLEYNRRLSARLDEKTSEGKWYRRWWLAVRSAWGRVGALLRRGLTRIKRAARRSK